MKGVLGLLWGGTRRPGTNPWTPRAGSCSRRSCLQSDGPDIARYDYANREAPVGDAETTDGPTLGVSFWAQTQVQLTLESQFLNRPVRPETVAQSASFCGPSERTGG